MTREHEPHCALVNPAALHLPGRPRHCTCEASVDQTPTTWYVEERKGTRSKPRWKRVYALEHMSQRAAEQRFLREATEKRRLINAAGTVTVSVPHGVERDE
jgi:hypothetical protein